MGVGRFACASSARRASIWSTSTRATKLYADVGLAIHAIRQELGYRGAIMLSTDMVSRPKV